MRSTSLFILWVLAGITLLHGVRAADQPSPSGVLQAGGATADALVAASVFTAQDIPQAEAGKQVWLTAKAWSYGIAYYDKWVYAVSKAEYILQFERDPATAKLTYKGATAFVGYHSDEVNPNIGCNIRRLADGNAVLTIFDGSENPGWWYAGDKGGIIWYDIDKDTGKLTAVGKQISGKFDKHNAQQLWTPDQQRFFVGGYCWSKIYWYRFARTVPRWKMAVLC